MQTVLELNADLLHQAKLFAEQKHTSLNNLVEEALSRYIQILPVYQGEDSLITDIDPPVFSATQLESLNTPSVYNGKSLTLQEMQEAIEWEASHST